MEVFLLILLIYYGKPISQTHLLTYQPKSMHRNMPTIFTITLPIQIRKSNHLAIQHIPSYSSPSYQIILTHILVISFISMQINSPTLGKMACLQFLRKIMICMDTNIILLPHASHYTPSLLLLAMAIWLTYRMSTIHYFSKCGNIMIHIISLSWHQHHMKYRTIRTLTFSLTNYQRYTTYRLKQQMIILKESTVAAAQSMLRGPTTM